MKALVLEKNGQLKYRDVQEPKPAKDECLVSVKAAGICNSDIYRCFEKGAYFYPLIMGHEAAGIVEKAGSNVKQLKKGDRVAIFPLIPCRQCEFCATKDYAQCLDYDFYGSRRHGAFAEKIAVKEWNLFKIPKGVSFEEASLLELIAVAVHALRKVSFKKGQRVAVLGAGLMGMVIARIISEKIGRENIILVDRNSAKLEKTKSVAGKRINSRLNPQWFDQLKKQGGVDIAIEACGAVDTYRQTLHIVKSHGVVIWIGNITGKLELSKLEVSSLIRREIKIIGVWNSRFTKHKSDDWHYAVKFIQKSGDLQKLISHRLSLSEGEKFFQSLYRCKQGKRDNREKTFLKTVFIL